MRVARGEIRVGWSELPEVVQELVAILCSDDWARHSTEDESAYYYVAGVVAWTADQGGQKHFGTQSTPRPLHVTPLLESEVHAQVAAAKPPRYYVESGEGEAQGGWC